MHLQSHYVSLIWSMDGEVAEMRNFCLMCGKTIPLGTLLFGKGRVCAECAQLLKRLQGIVGKRPGFERFFEEGFEADSLDLVELVMALEEEFQITIPQDEAESIKTVAEAIRIIVKHLDHPT